MRRTRGWTRLGTSVVALGLVAGGGARAATTPTASATVTAPSGTLLGYDTAMSSIDATGITTTGGASPTAVTYVPVAGGTFLTPSSLSLGSFQAASLADGQSVTYNNTPFHIMFSADAINGQSGFQPNQTPIDISGVFNGTLTGSTGSTLTATFDKPAASALLNANVDPTQVATYSFMTGLYTNTMTLPDNPLHIVPASSNDGLTTAQAVLNNSAITAPVPEPSTVVIFAATLAGLGFRYRIRRARAAAGAA